MKVDEITVDVKANLSVDRNTAEACLRLVQIFVNAHPELQIMAHKNETGETEFFYEPVK